VAGLAWIDPVASLFIVGAILVSTWGLLRDSVNLALDARAAGIDPVLVREYLQNLPGSPTFTICTSGA